MNFRLVVLVLVLSNAVPGSEQAAPKATATAEGQQRRWHDICIKQNTQRGGGGHFYRQCIKDQRALDRARHADGLRENLAAEMALFHERGRTQGTGGRGTGGRAGRPHILLITTDQQRRDTLGCYGPVLAREGLAPLAPPGAPPFQASSPNLDRLASEGLLVEDAWAAAPVCAPSRTSLLLGVHVPVHGVAENGLGASPRPISASSLATSAPL